MLYNFRISSTLLKNDNMTYDTVYSWVLSHIGSRIDIKKMQPIWRISDDEFAYIDLRKHNKLQYVKLFSFVNTNHAVHFKLRWMDYIA